MLLREEIKVGDLTVNSRETFSVGLSQVKTEFREGRADRLSFSQQKGTSSKREAGGGQSRRGVKGGNKKGFLQTDTGGEKD